MNDGEMTCELPPSPFLAPTPDGVAITALIDGQDATTAQEGIPLLFRYVLMEVSFFFIIIFFYFFFHFSSRVIIFNNNKKKINQHFF